MTIDARCDKSPAARRAVSPPRRARHRMYSAPMSRKRFMVAERARGSSRL
jgi:hypothetical protein